MISEEQIEKLFKRWELDVNWPNAFRDHRSASLDSFKAAFTLLMPIIEKQMEALMETRKALPLDGEKYACAFCDMGGAGYSSKGEGCHDDDCFFYLSDRAIQETKQMLEKQLEEVK